MNRQMLPFIAKFIMTLFFLVTLNFFLPRMMPGDPFYFISGDEGDVTISFSEEEIAKLKAYYDLDKPLGQQYVNYLKNLLNFNLGYSIYYGDDVISIIKSRIPWTLSLVLLSVFLGSTIGTVLGCLSAWYHESLLDRFLYFIMLIVSEIPSFLIGLLLLFLVAAQWGIFPLSGGMKPFANYSSNFDKVLDLLHHGFLPCLTLVLAGVGGFYLIARNSTISVMSKDYITTARAKGLRRNIIVFRHALLNAALPIVTRLFYSMGSAVGGAVLAENVFNYPGLGSLMRHAVMVRDYPLLQGIFLIVTLLVLSMNLISDFVYKKIDPRVI